MPNKILLPILLSLLLLVGATCPSNIESSTAKQILHLGNGTAEPKDLDPHTVTGVPEHNIISAHLKG